MQALVANNLIIIYSHEVHGLRYCRVSSSINVKLQPCMVVSYFSTDMNGKNYHINVWQK